jgi:hypothetical protein
VSTATGTSTSATMFEGVAWASSGGGAFMLPY